MMTHKSQDGDRCSEEDESGLKGLEGKTYHEREDLECRVRTGDLSCARDIAHRDDYEGIVGRLLGCPLSLKVLNCS
jgi:hypothetical protein